MCVGWRCVHGDERWPARACPAAMAGGRAPLGERPPAGGRGAGHPDAAGRPCTRTRACGALPADGAQGTRMPPSTLVAGDPRVVVDAHGAQGTRMPPRAPRIRAPHRPRQAQCAAGPADLIPARRSARAGRASIAPDLRSPPARILPGTAAATPARPGRSETRHPAARALFGAAGRVRMRVRRAAGPARPVRGCADGRERP